MRFLNSKQLSRRTLMRAGAVSLGLPLLDAMLPAGVRAEAKAAALAPRRMVFVARDLGTVEEHFFPKQTGINYEAPRYLKFLDKHRGKFTVFSGIGHLGYPNQHHTWHGLLSGVEASRIQRGDDIRNTISLDQFAAHRLRGQTREACILMNYGNGGAGLSYNRDGAVVPGFTYESHVFQRLFIEGKPEEVAKEVRRLQNGKSILDGVRDQLKGLSQSVGASDRNRLDLFGSSVRDAEQQLQQDEAWLFKPKPTVDRKLEDYRQTDWNASQRLWYDLAYLAFQTDITRVAVIVSNQGTPGVAVSATIAHHDASHHGQDPAKMEQLALYEDVDARNMGVFLDQLASSESAGGSLLDDTIVLWASNIGNASAHSSSNLPVLVAGGGLKHQGHVAFDLKNNYPLSNLYVRILHQMGIEADKFGSCTGILSDLG